jgi:drug/metabolite transporter (DMT)-like permease
MSLAVLGLVLTAAVAHAGWNFMAKGAEGGAAFVWLGAVAGSLIYLPALALALVVAPGQLGWAAIGFMAGSGVLHAVYFTLLQRGYAAGDLSFVYPLARGTGPLLSTAAGIVILAERPSAMAIAGAATIAAYTIWDKQAVGPSALAPIVYYWGSNAVNALVLTPWVVRRPDRLRTAWTTSRSRAAWVGLLSPLAYVLVLYALARAPVSYVAPARETSILIGTLLGTTLLAEGDARRRLLVAGAILVGVTALALG